MNQEKALQIIIEALNISIKNGCFGLIETTNIVKAIEVLKTPQVETVEIIS